MAPAMALPHHWKPREQLRLRVTDDLGLVPFVDAGAVSESVVPDLDASVQFGNLIVSAQRIEQSGRTEVFDIAMELGILPYYL